MPVPSGARPSRRAALRQQPAADGQPAGIYVAWRTFPGRCGLGRARGKT